MGVNIPLGYFNSGNKLAMVHTAQVSIGNTPTLIAERNNGRLGIVITNTGTVTVYVGLKQDVANNNGHALLPGGSLSLVTPTALYAYAATGNPVVTYLEEITR